MVRLVLFDIDGTLIHTGGAGVKAFAKVFETEFKAVDGFERMKFSGRTDISLVREFFSYHQIQPSAENFQRFFDRYGFWLDHILQKSECQVCPGVWELLRGLKALPQAPVIGLLTGNIRLGAEIKLRHLHLWEVFETGAFADDDEQRDKIAAVARERGGRILKQDLAGDEVIVIGDTPLDIQCARAIGAKALAVATGSFSVAELKLHGPAWALEDLREITASEAVNGVTAPKR